MIPEAADMPHLHIQATVNAVALQLHRFRWLSLSAFASHDGSSPCSCNEISTKRLTHLEDCQVSLTNLWTVRDWLSCVMICRAPTPAGVVSAAPVRYKTDDRVDSNIVTAAQVAMLGMPAHQQHLMFAPSCPCNSTENECSVIDVM